MGFGNKWDFVKNMGSCWSQGRFVVSRFRGVVELSGTSLTLDPPVEASGYDVMSDWECVRRQQSFSCVSTCNYLSTQFEASKLRGAHEKSSKTAQRSEYIT